MTHEGLFDDIDTAFDRYGCGITEIEELKDRLRAFRGDIKDKVSLCIKDAIRCSNLLHEANRSE